MPRSRSERSVRFTFYPTVKHEPDGMIRESGLLRHSPENRGVAGTHTSDPPAHGRAEGTNVLFPPQKQRNERRAPDHPVEEFALVVRVWAIQARPGKAISEPLEQGP